MTLKTGISGLRGTVDGSQASLTATVAVRWTQSFVALLTAKGHGDRPRVILGRDGRLSSPALCDLARGALVAAGAEVIDIGLTSTPTVQLAAAKDPLAAGGVMVTASHNPLMWNGLKFVDEAGLFLPATDWDRMGTLSAPSVGLDQFLAVKDGAAAATAQHRDAVIAGVPADDIRAKSFRVIIDACNGPALAWADTLRALGCRVQSIHADQDGIFERGPEPVPVNLGELRAAVATTGADIGFAADPDGDRLALVDNTGASVSEELTVVLAALAMAEPGDTVVTNVVTTHALDAALVGVTVARTAVGEMNVVAGLDALGAVIGGEGSGGVIVPGINLARDGMAAAATILTLMAHSGRTLAELVASIPRWDSVKATLPAPQRADFTAVVAKVSSATSPKPGVVVADGDLGAISLGFTRAGGGRVAISIAGHDTSAKAGDFGEVLARIHQEKDDLCLDVSDGVKFSSPTAWISLRSSNTEPILRLMGEIRR
ncbi:MAG: hypothetical protein ACSLEW_13365 [Nocardioides sp.]